MTYSYAIKPCFKSTALLLMDLPSLMKSLSKQVLRSILKGSRNARFFYFLPSPQQTLSGKKEMRFLFRNTFNGSVSERSFSDYLKGYASGSISLGNGQA